MQMSSRFVLIGSACLFTSLLVASIPPGQVENLADFFPKAKCQRFVVHCEFSASLCDAI